MLRCSVHDRFIVHFPGDLGGDLCLRSNQKQGLVKHASDLGTLKVVFLEHLGCPILVSPFICRRRRRLPPN